MSIFHHVHQIHALSKLFTDSLLLQVQTGFFSFLKFALQTTYNFAKYLPHHEETGYQVVKALTHLILINWCIIMAVNYPLTEENTNFAN